MKRLFYSVLFYLFSLSVPGQISLKEGDFLFLDLDCGPLCDAIEGVTPGYGKMKFSHVGMLVSDSGKWKVLEAIGKNVKLTDLNAFLAYSKDKALVARLKNKFQGLIPKAKSFGLSQLGMPYDDAFLPDNGKWYCSELLYAAFKNANGEKPLFSLSKMTFKKPGSNQFFPAWVDYYSKMSIPIPEGLPGCNPGGLCQSECLEILGFFQGKD